MAAAVPCTPDDPGDATGDGYIDAGDITYVERVILSLSIETNGSDANEDSTVDVTDIGVIEYMILEIWPWKEVHLVLHEGGATINSGPVDTNFSAYVIVSTVWDLDSGNYDVIYDPTVLEVTNVSDGWAKDVYTGEYVTVDVANWGFIPPATQGRVRIINNQPGPPVNASGYLAEIHFKVITGECGAYSDVEFLIINSSWPNLFDSLAVAIPGVTWFNASTFTVDPCTVPTPSPTPTASATATSTASATPTSSATATPSSTATASPTATATASASPTSTATASASPTSTATASASPSPTSTATASASPTSTATASASPSPTATATASASPSPTATATASASPTATATSTASPTTTATASATATASPSPTPTPTPTGTVTGPETSIYFNQSSYNVTGDCGEFVTDILIEPPVNFFSACQFRLAWNASLFYPYEYALDWTPIDQRGAICIGAACVGPMVKYTQSAGFNPTGIQNCPTQYHRGMTYTDIFATTFYEGCLNAVADFGVTAGGDGYNVTVPSGAQKNRLMRFHWITSGSCTDSSFDYGTTANYGTTDIVFYPVGSSGGQGLKCSCADNTVVYDLEDVYTLTWINASVTVE